MSHTPGPWYVGTMNDCLFIINQPPSPSGSDVPVDTPHPGLEVIAKLDYACSVANANLIAAAPELLRRLKIMCREWRETIGTPENHSTPGDCLERSEQLIAQVEKRK